MASFRQVPYETRVIHDGFPLSGHNLMHHRKSATVDPPVRTGDSPPALMGPQSAVKRLGSCGFCHNGSRGNESEIGNFAGPTAARIRSTRQHAISATPQSHTILPCGLTPIREQQQLTAAPSPFPANRAAAHAARMALKLLLEGSTLAGMKRPGRDFRMF